MVSTCAAQKLGVFDLPSLPWSFDANEHTQNRSDTKIWSKTARATFLIRLVKAEVRSSRCLDCAIEGSEGVGGLFEHLPGHGNRIAQLFKMQRRYAFRSGQGDDLIIDQAKEVFDRLELALDQFYRSFEIIECGDSAFQDFDVACWIRFSRSSLLKSDRVLSLLQ